MLPRPGRREREIRNYYRGRWGISARSSQEGWENPVRVGIIGCGTIGAVHAHAAAASDQIELVAVADVQRALAEKIAAAYAVETIYGDGADLLADARVEAVALGCAS